MGSWPGSQLALQTTRLFVAGIGEMLRGLPEGLAFSVGFSGGR